jgi:tetratricopeptide (TPR) repeat protein
VRCSGCGATVEAGAWICPACDHILDPNVLGPEPALESIIVDDPLDPASDLADFDVVDGPGVRIYASQTTSRRILQMDVVPRRLPLDGRAEPTLDPHEALALSLIDGVRDVTALLEESRLSPESLSAALLTLLDKRLIASELPPGAEREWDEDTPADGTPSPKAGADRPSEALQEALFQAAASPRSPTQKPEPKTAADAEFELRISEPPAEPPTAHDAPLPPPDFDVTVSEPAEPSEDVDIAELERVSVPAPPVGPPAAAPAALVPLSSSELTSSNARASKLLKEAWKDEQAGKLSSARVNLKLALSFDPQHAGIQAALNRLTSIPPQRGRTEVSRARQLADRALDAERAGRVDDAIRFLEEAIAAEPRTDASYYNRLGVLLALKRGQFQRGQQLLETALELAPGNLGYEQNLERVKAIGRGKPPSRAGSVRGSSAITPPPRTPPRRSGSLLALFGKKD